MMYYLKRWITGCIVGVTVFASVASADTAVYFIHNDHLGTPQVVTNQSQSVVWEADYSPFGEVDITNEQVPLNARFPGQYADEASGVYYNYYRDYDQTIGRYIQSDPVGLQGGVNTYGYSGQNPIVYVDFYGLEYYPQWSPFNGDLYLYNGATVEQWIADVPGEIVSGCGAATIPKDSDLDFIKVNGRWYKIKWGTAFVTEHGHVIGQATYDIYAPHYIYPKFVDGGTPSYVDYIAEYAPTSSDIGCECLD